MKSFLLGFLFTLSLAAQAQVVLSSKTDESFGGYYVDVDKTMVSLSASLSKKVSIAEVLNLQNYFRDCLQEKSGSFFRNNQTPFLNECLSVGLKKMKALRPVTLGAGLNVVFDMDETLLTQWHRIAVQNPERTSLVVVNRDHVLKETKGEITFAPRGATVRPGAYKILKDLANNPKIAKVFFFSAREDKSAEELGAHMLKVSGFPMKKFGGLYTRNHLRLDSTTKTPSKDLRIISPSLKKIILIDDNPGRVIQKELNFSIPKFNADMYLDAKVTNDQDVIVANEAVFPFVYSIISDTANGMSFYMYSTEYADAHVLNWGALIMTTLGMDNGTIEGLLKNKLFIQDFFGGETVKP